MDYKLLTSSVPENMHPDSGFLFGQTIFTTMKVVLRKKLFFEDHWERLERGVSWLWEGESIAPLKESILQELDEVVGSTRLGAIRITFFKIDEKLNWSIHQTKLDRVHLHPLKLKIVTHPSHAFLRPDFVKMGSYGEILRLKSHVEAEGYDDIILKSTSDELLETSFGNLIFLSESNEYIFPSYDTGYLAGITRCHILKALTSAGKKVVEKKFSATEVEVMKSAWVVSSITGVRSVCKVDDKVLSVDTELASLWQDYLEKING